MYTETLEGQMTIFDFIDDPNEEPKEKPKCSKAEECEAYQFGCGGTIEPCRFGGPYKWSNKSEESK